MSLADLAALPPHLLAASIVRGRERLPVRVHRLGPDGLIVVGPAGLAVRERARVSIACPLRGTTCEVVAEAVRTSAGRTWLALV